MAIQQRYIDLTIGGTGQAGTTGDPWSWGEFITQVQSTIGITGDDYEFYFRGDHRTTVGSTQRVIPQYGNTGGQYSHFKQWPGEAEAIIAQQSGGSAGFVFNNNTIENIEFNGLKFFDGLGAAINPLYTGTGYFRIRNCIFFDNNQQGGEGPTGCIRLQGGGGITSTSFEIDSCSFHGASISSYRCINRNAGTGTVTIVVNNCVFENFSDVVFRNDNTSGAITYAYCSFFNNGSTSSGAGTVTDNGNNDTRSQTQFNDPSSEDFTLAPGAASIDDGDTTLTVDYDGTSRPQGAADDKGAYESVVTNSQPFVSIDSITVRSDTNYVDVTFTGQDNDDDTCSLPVVQYCLPNGSGFLDATLVTGDPAHSGVAGLVFPSGGFSFNLVWNAPADASAELHNPTKFRIQPFDGTASGNVDQSSFSLDLRPPTDPPSPQLNTGVQSQKPVITLGVPAEEAEAQLAAFRAQVRSVDRNINTGDVSTSPGGIGRRPSPARVDKDALVPDEPQSAPLSPPPDNDQADPQV